MENITQPCQHYKRGCEIQAPCCKIWYPCRLCHNELYRGPKADWCHVETLDRQNISLVRCLKCKLEQLPSSVCSNQECGNDLGKYFCQVCKLFNNDTKKHMYHCDKCNMCRIGKQQEMFHCDLCDICMNISLKSSHKCLQNKTESDCPICLENIRNSVKPWQQLNRCGHCIHLECFNTFASKLSFINCPLCSVSVYVSSDEDKIYQENQVKHAEKMMDDELKKAVEGKKATILCSECGKKSLEVQFSLVAIKCEHCSSYNTRQI